MPRPAVAAAAIIAEHRGDRGAEALLDAGVDGGILAGHAAAAAAQHRVLDDGPGGVGAGLAQALAHQRGVVRVQVHAHIARRHRQQRDGLADDRDDLVGLGADLAAHDLARDRAGERGQLVLDLFVELAQGLREQLEDLRPVPQPLVELGEPRLLFLARGREAGVATGGETGVPGLALQRVEVAQAAAAAHQRAVDRRRHPGRHAYGSLRHTPLRRDHRAPGALRPRAGAPSAGSPSARPPPRSA
ncbi:MAG: hypothetical protein U1F06_06545 [Steroidobacteraceae bacterium]